MQKIKRFMILKGLLLAGVFLLLATIPTLARTDNNLYPIYNTFMFNQERQITSGIENQTLKTELGYRVHSITSSKDASKVRFIFSIPDFHFDQLLLRVKLSYNELTTAFIRGGHLHNITVNVYPFELTIIDGVNGSVQVVDAYELYRGTTLTFNFNETAFIEEEYFEVSFSSWNSMSCIKEIQFEQIKFQLHPPEVVTGPAVLFLCSTISLLGLAQVFPQYNRFFTNLILLLFLMLTPLAAIYQIKSIMELLPDREEGVTRFTFFGQVYERRDLGNGYFSLKKIKDLSTAFELKALSGTGAQIVYPIKEISSETNIPHYLESIEDSSNSEPTSLPPPINETASIKPMYPHLGAGEVNISTTNISIRDADSGVIHSKYKFYKFEVIVFDLDGQGDIEYVQLNFTINSFEYSVAYDNRTETFLEVNDHASDHITLDLASPDPLRIGYYLNVTFKIQTDWDLPNADSIALTAWANDTSTNSDSKTSATTYDFNHNIEVASFNVNDQTVNPDTGLFFTGSVYYEGTFLEVPDSEITVVTVFRDSTPSDINIATQNSTEAGFSVTGNSEATVGSYTYYPFVELAGDGTEWNLSATTIGVIVDRVKITDISISNAVYYDGSSTYWDNNDGITDEITITVEAVWERTSIAYTGEVRLGHSGDSDWQTTTGLSFNADENPILGTVKLLTSINVTAAIEGTGNEYGSQIYLDPSLIYWNIGWDNAAPTGGTWTTDYDLDDNTGDGYAPYAGPSGSYDAFYDDTSYTADVSSVSDTGAGIANYSIKSDEQGTYGVTKTNGLDISCTLVEGANSISFRIVDRVGNVYSGTTDLSIYYSSTAIPSGFDIDISGTAVWTLESPSFAYIANPNDITSGILYLGAGGDTQWSITMDNSGTWNAGGAWKVVFEAGWGTSQKVDDTSGDGYTSLLYHSDTGSEPDITIDIVNRNGLVQQIVLTTTADTTGPTLDSITVVGDSLMPGYSDWDQDGIGFSITPAGITDSGVGTNMVLYEVDDATPDADGGYNSSDSPFIYPIDVGTSGSYTFYARAVDKVGNEGVVRSDIGYVDDSPPSFDTISFIDADFNPNWYDQGASAYATLQIAFFETNVYSIDVICTINLIDRATNATAGQTSPFNSIITLSSAFIDDSYTINITITDKVGQTVTNNTNIIKLDNTAPSITDVMSDYFEDAGDLGDVFGDIINNIFYFSNSFLTSATVTFTATGEDNFDGSGVRGIDFGLFGEDPPEDPSAPYTGQYIINNDDADGTIIVTIYDNVGNSNSSTITCIQDDTNPTISITSEVENSDYLYVLISGSEGVYGSKMNSNSQTYVISGTAFDSGSDLNNISDNTGFGNNPSNTGTLSNWEFIYLITASDNGNVVITYTVTDNVGNTATDVYTFYEDNTNPSLTDAMSAYNEAGDINEVHGVIVNDWFYFSNSIPSSATVTFTATGTDGLAGVYGIEFGAFGADLATNDTSAPYQGVYSITNADSSGTITVTIYDNVGNYVSDTITCTEDATNPSISVTGESEDSDYLYVLTPTSEGIYGSRMGTGQVYTIYGTATDSSSGLASVDDGTPFNNPARGGTLASWQFTYSITASDGGTVVITYTATDNVGNTATDVYTFYEDNTNPSLTDAMSAYAEAGDIGDVYAVTSSNWFYFSNSIPSSATVTFTATGTDGLAG
ncbi:MAG: hypothetical protein EAX86_13475, partial [Candidatus Heimdallarchaeota archaeon]|nr:hypothetical protein [Candidatus Heimdallarchaeota archaeon]